MAACNKSSIDNDLYYQLGYHNQALPPFGCYHMSSGDAGSASRSNPILSLVYAGTDDMSETNLATEWLPLTSAQFDLWEEFAFHPDQPISTVAHYIHINGAVDERALCRAIEATITETDVFTLRFREQGAGLSPLQQCDPTSAPCLQQIVLSDNPDPERVALALMQADIDQPLNLLHPPLAVIWLFKLSPSHYIWYIRAHHIIIDGFSMMLIEHRAAELYAYFLGKGAIGLPLHAFLPFLAEEQAYIVSQRHQQDRLYWREHLLAEVTLPVLCKHGQDYGAKCQRINGMLPTEVTTGLLKLAARCGIGWPDLLMVLSAAYLMFHLPREEGAAVTLPVWIPLMNRRGPVATYVPALAMNILPLLVSVGPQETLAIFLPRMTRELRKLCSHGRYRIEQLAADQGILPGTRYFFSPLVNVLPFELPLFSGCQAERKVMANGLVDGFNITYRSRMDASELNLDIAADPRMYPANGLGAHHKRLQAFLLLVVQPAAWERQVAQLIQLG